MSQIKVNAVTDGSGGNTATINSMTPTADSLQGFRNRIINGAMGIWQRGTTYTGTGAGASQFGSVDRWAFGQFPTAYTSSRSTDVPSGSVFQYSLKIQRTAGQTSTAQANTIQAIESVNMYDMAGQSVTLSFWAKAGTNFSMASSAMGVILTTGTVADQGSYASQGGWTGQAYPVNTTQVLTTSWQKFTFTGTFGSTALEAAVYFYMIGVGTAGADDSMFITGVQLEVGSVATPFERRDYGRELIMCYRYYYRIVSGADDPFGMAFCIATTATNGMVQFPVTMRVSPSALETNGTASDYRVRHGGSSTNCSSVPAFADSSPSAARISFSVASGLTVGQGAMMSSSVNGNVYLGFSSEL